MTDAPSRRSRLRADPLIMALAVAPTIWIVAFFVIYLGAEVACTGPETVRESAPGWLDPFVLVTTVVASAAIAAIALAQARSAGGGGSTRPEVRIVAVLSGFIFLLGVLALGLPVVVLEPC